MCTEMLIDELDLSVRSRNCLMRAHISTVEALISLIAEDVEPLYRIRNLGKKCAEEVLYKLSAFGYDFIDAVLEKEILSAENNDAKMYWENVRKSCKLWLGTAVEKLEDIPYDLRVRLYGKGVYSVEQLLNNYDAIDELDMSLDLKCELLKILDQNGYRMKDCPVDQYPNINEFIRLKKAETTTVDSLKIDTDIMNALAGNGIAKVSELVTQSSSILIEWLNQRQIAVLLRALDAHPHRFRMADFPLEEYPEIETAISQAYPVSLNDLGFSKQNILKFEKMGVYTLNDLRAFTRQELLEQKNVGITLLKKVIDALHANMTCLTGDKIYICSKCGQEFVDVQNNEREHFCNPCREKIIRVQAAKEYTVSLHGPDYRKGSLDSRGFSLYATLHNNTFGIADATLKDFKIFSDGRQWAAAWDISGYEFKSGHILPGTSQTMGKVWSENFWTNRKLEEGDYVLLAFEIGEKGYVFKFLRTILGWEFDDYHSYKL